MRGPKGTGRRIRPGRKKTVEPNAADTRYLHEKLEEMAKQIDYLSSRYEKMLLAFGSYVLHQQNRRKDAMQVALLAESSTPSLREFAQEFPANLAYVLGSGDQQLTRYEDSILMALVAPADHEIPDPIVGLFDNTASALSDDEEEEADFFDHIAADGPEFEASADDVVSQDRPRRRRRT